MQSQPYGSDPRYFGDTGPYPASPYASAPSGSYPSASYPVPPATMQPVQPMAPYATTGRPLPPSELEPPPLDARQRALLAVLIYNPIALVAYLLYLYGPGTGCVAGPFCAFGNLPSVLQGLLMLIGAGLLWGLIALGMRWLLASTPWHSSFARTIRGLTEYHLVRPLLGLYGGVILLAWLIALFTGRLTPAALIFGAVTAFVCLRCALGRAPVPVPPGPRTA